MGKAMSQDLLWVIVEKRLFYGDTLEKIAADTLQPLSTVGRVLARKGVLTPIPADVAGRASWPAGQREARPDSS